MFKTVDATVKTQVMRHLRGCIERIMKEEKGGILPSFLLLLSILYGLIQRVRAFLYKKDFLNIKKIEFRVISVGNITVGGTGKTPAVISIAQVAKEKGFKVAILTRGYGGKVRGINPVTDGTNIFLGPIDAGDEPYLMAKKLHGVPIVKGKDRYLSARFAIERFRSNLFILDDGFQYLKLNRDVNILLIDATDPFGNGYLFPKGILREPLTAIRRADIVVITKSDLSFDEAQEMSKKNRGIIDKIREYSPSAPIIFSYYRPLDLVNMKGDIMSIEDIKGRALFLFSGLASPSSFRLLLERYGAKIISELTYPDHFYYSKKDIEAIKERAISLGADMIVTTEKDIVRIPYLEGDPESSSVELWALRIDFIIEDKERWKGLLFPKGSLIGGDS